MLEYLMYIVWIQKQILTKYWQCKEYFYQKYKYIRFKYNFIININIFKVILINSFLFTLIMYILCY